MEYLQIWIGNKPTKKMFKDIKTVTDKLTDSDVYTIICSNKWKVLDDIPNLNWIDLEPFVKEMESDNKIIKNFWKCIPKDPKYYWVYSDVIRFYYMSKKKNVFYCDTDIKLYDIPIFDNTKPYFGTCKQKYIDYNIIFNGDNTEYFEDFLFTMIDYYNHINKNGDRNNISRTWIWNILNSKNNKKKIVTIPPEYYEHLDNWTNTYRKK